MWFAGFWLIADQGHGPTEPGDLSQARPLPVPLRQFCADPDLPESPTAPSLKPCEQATQVWPVLIRWQRSTSQPLGLAEGLRQHLGKVGDVLRLK